MVQFFKIQTRTRKIILFTFLLVITGIFFLKDKAFAFGECSDYGYMASYDYITGGCKCMSGYVFGKDFLGQTTCVSGSSVCSDKYGYHSRYDSLSESCECSYGYTFGKDLVGRTQCVSFDSLCTDQLGYNARYNSLYDKCECRSGYVINNGKCTNGDSACRSKHGLYSSYNDSANSCECDNGYTLDELDQCVKKQNNVYFTLRELDTDAKKAIIKSNYDFGYYLISYGFGCYSSSFRRYINRNFVVNLGTDFDVDAWDKIVLQDDDEVCDITRVERANSSTTLVPEEEDQDTFFFVPQVPQVPQPVPVKEPTSVPETPILALEKEFVLDNTKIKRLDPKIVGELRVVGALRECPSTTACAVLKYLPAKTKIDIDSTYNGEEWYGVRKADVPTVSGWIHSSVMAKIENKKNQDETVVAATGTAGTMSTQIKEEPLPWYKKCLVFLSKLFKKKS